MDTITEEFTITLKYQVKINTETGEMTSKCIKRTIDKSNFEVVDNKKKESNPNPIITVEDNKYVLTKAAAELMNVNPDDKLEIKYEKHNKTMRPVIGTNVSWGTMSGNRLTKSLTVSCKGAKREELVKYGTVFNIVPHESREGLFVLTGDTEQEVLEGDENISVDDDLSLDLSILDNEVKEIDSNFFKL